MTKKQILMNKPVYLGLSILELSKIVMYEFWYDYVKPKYSIVKIKKRKTKKCVVKSKLNFENCKSCFRSNST